MIAFFNDLEGREYAGWYPAVQYLGTKGFFSWYESRPDDLLDKRLSDKWISSTLRYAQHPTAVDPNALARELIQVEDHWSIFLSAEEFIRDLNYEFISEGLEVENRTAKNYEELKIQSDVLLKRGDAARIIFELMSTR